MVNFVWRKRNDSGDSRTSTRSKLSKCFWAMFNDKFIMCWLIRIYHSRTTNKLFNVNKALTHPVIQTRLERSRFLLTFPRLNISFWVFHFRGGKAKKWIILNVAAVRRYWHVWSKFSLKPFRTMNENYMAWFVKCMRSSFRIHVNMFCMAKWRTEFQMNCCCGWTSSDSARKQCVTLKMTHAQQHFFHYNSSDMLDRVCLIKKRWYFSISF